MSPSNVEPIQLVPAETMANGSLIGSSATIAAAASVGELIRAVSSDRGAAVSRSGITIEDIVREEIRPIVKDWLETQLPLIVERIVRSEIERVVARATP